jgi:predicted secreted Zn-dependent protease
MTQGWFFGKGIWPGHVSNQIAPYRLPKPPPCPNFPSQLREASMRAIFGMAIGAAVLCSALGSREALSAPAFTTKYVYYKVSGDSAAGVYVSMLKRGPHVKGERAYAATSAESSQRGKLELKNSCRIIDYQYSIDFVIRLPKLTGEGSLSPSARARWQQFSGFLRKHEETHRSIWIGCANNIEARVRALRGRSCDEVDRKAQAIREQVQNACNRKHMAFDAAEQKRLAKHPFVKMVLAPIYNPVKAKTKTTKLASKKRKKSAALFN